MIEVKAPNVAPKGSMKVFLAGSIEMGKATPWQEWFVREVRDLDLVVLNPRRDDWNPDWKQSPSNEEFAEQVNWEMDGLMTADIVVFYFDPDTLSPITLLELGFVSTMYDKPVLVCCPEGFWRKGNVDILCIREKMIRCASFDELVVAFRESYQLLFQPTKGRVVPYGVVYD